MSEFDGTHPIDEGVDLTAEFGSYAATLTQAIREAKPSTLYGFIIFSVDTPPTLGADAWRKRCLWLRSDTRKLYYFNEVGGSWESIENIFDAVEVKDESVTLAKLFPNEGSALYVLRKNVGNTGWELVPATSLFLDGQIVWSRLAIAFAGAVPRANSSGVLVPWDADAAIANAIGISPIDFNQVEDLRNAAADGQIPYFAVTGGVLSVAYVETLLRDGQLPTRKLQLGASNAGKAVFVNASGTDLSYQTGTNTVRVAVVADGAKAANTYGQTLSPGATAIVELTVKNDPDGIVSLISNQFTLGPGTYHIHLDVPITPQSSSAVKYNFYHLQLYNATNASEVARRTVWHDTDASTTSSVNAMLDSPVKIDVETKFEVRLVASSANAVDAYLGRPANIAAKNEIYSMVTIQKL